MSSFGIFIKRLRIEAGLTQAQLAERMEVSINTIQNWEKGKHKVDHDHYPRLSEVLNIPLDVLVREYCREQDKKRSNNWPAFLFEDELNDIIDILHLNMNQQELFGLLYIYKAKYLQKESIDYNTIFEDINRIPYQFIDKVGSIQFLNLVDGLQRVIKYVKTEFLLNILKSNPEYEFDVRRLTKEQICEFIDAGLKPMNVFEECNPTGLDIYEGDDAITFNICMKKAIAMLTILEKGPIHVTDDRWSNKIRKDIPREVIEALEYNYDLWLEYYDLSGDSTYYGGYNFCGGILRDGISTVTTYHNVAGAGEKVQWYLEMNELGQQLLAWYRE